MACAFSQVTESELEHAVNRRFSLGNKRAANDNVIKAMDGMDLPDLYRSVHGELHTADDGQKFEVRDERPADQPLVQAFRAGKGYQRLQFR